jgi:hypothetical protein
MLQPIARSGATPQFRCCVVSPRALRFARHVTLRAPKFFHKPLDFAKTRREPPVSHTALDRHALSPLNVARTSHSEDNNNMSSLFHLWHNFDPTMLKLPAVCVPGGEAETLRAKREAQLKWMRERGVRYLGNPMVWPDRRARGSPIAPNRSRLGEHRLCG